MDLALELQKQNFKTDRYPLFQQIKQIVFASDENVFMETYQQLLHNETSQKYPRFLKRVQTLMI